MHSHGPIQILACCSGYSSSVIKQITAGAVVATAFAVSSAAAAAAAADSAVALPKLIVNTTLHQHTHSAGLSCCIAQAAVAADAVVALFVKTEAGDRNCF